MVDTCTIAYSVILCLLFYFIHWLSTPNIWEPLRLNWLTSADDLSLPDTKFWCRAKSLTGGAVPVPNGLFDSWLCGRRRKPSGSPFIGSLHPPTPIIPTITFRPKWIHSLLRYRSRTEFMCMQSGMIISPLLALNFSTGLHAREVNVKNKVTTLCASFMVCTLSELWLCEFDVSGI